MMLTHTQDVSSLQPEQVLTFDHVAVYFSEEEWGCLEEEQKDMYKDVMMENFRSLQSLGYIHVKPDIISVLEKGEEPWIKEPGIRWNLLSPTSSTENVWQQEESASLSPLRMMCTVVEFPCLSDEDQIIHTDRKLFICHECGKCFTQYATLLLHYRMHKGEPAFTCSDCGKVFSQKSDLINHVSIHTGQNPYCCSVCGKCFGIGSALIKHERTHTGEKPVLRSAEKCFLCWECGTGFSNASELASHKLMHATVKPFSCLECPKSFCRKSSLVEHQRVHSTDNLFTCTDCGKCFYKRSNLEQHQRTHTDKKPFPCPDCDKHFSRKRLLIRHQAVHKEAAMFPCADCGKRFTRETSLANHQKVHEKKPVVYMDVIKGLLFGYQQAEGPSSSSTGPRIVPGQHFPNEIPSTGKKGRTQKRCRVCYKKGIRKESIYYCETCPDLPGLCIKECFKIYHTSMDH